MSNEMIHRLMSKFEIMSVEDREVLLKYVRTEPHLSYSYAVIVAGVPYPEGEELISTNGECSYWYAVALRERFEAGEGVIATDAYRSYHYALEVLKGRFELGEAEIAKNEWLREEYSQRFLNGEPFW